MPFIATCSFCRGSKFRVPFKKRGTFATCPKCEHEFLLTPESGVNVPLMTYKELPFDDEQGAEPEEAPAELIETLPEHAPVPDHEPSATDRVESVSVVVAPAISRPIDEWPLRFALLAFILFGLGMMATLFPYGRALSVGFTLLGVVLGVMGWLGLEAFTWLGSVGTGVNALALVVALVFPSWFGYTGWIPEDDPEVGPKVPMSVGRGDHRVRPADWVDAANAVWELGDTRVAITSVGVGPADGTNKSAKDKKERVLRIGVKLSNIGVARSIEFTGWQNPPSAEAKLLAAGNPVAVRTAAMEKILVFPGKSHETTLTFAVPESFEQLKLELSAQAFGGSEPIRFEIPRAMIFMR